MFRRVPLAQSISAATGAATDQVTAATPISWSEQPDDHDAEILIERNRFLRELADQADADPKNQTWPRLYAAAIDFLLGCCIGSVAAYLMLVWQGLGGAFQHTSTIVVVVMLSGANGSVLGFLARNAGPRDRWWARRLLPITLAFWVFLVLMTQWRSEAQVNIEGLAGAMLTGLGVNFFASMVLYLVSSLAQRIKK